MKLPTFLTRLSGDGKSPPTPTARSADLPSDPALDEMIAKPKFMVDPVFPKEAYLEVFGRGLFPQILRQSNRSDAIARIQTTANTRQMVTLMAITCGLWALDLDAISDRGVLGKDEFIGRVRHPVRRPPPQLAAVVAEQHILAKGVVQIQIDDGPPMPGNCRLCSLKTVGWYAAVLMLPRT